MIRHGFSLGFSLLLLFSLYPVPSWALESAILRPSEEPLDSTHEFFRAHAGQSPTWAAQPGLRACTGAITIPGMKLPSIHHLALITPQGQNLPLTVERSSLRFEADRITHMVVAFEIPPELLLSQPLKLVWSNDLEPLANNREIHTLILDPQAAGMTYEFHLALPDAADTAAGSTVLVEVDPQAAWHAWWYLYPLVIILILAWLWRWIQPQGVRT